MKDRDFIKLQEQLDNYFEEQFRSILNDPIAIDEGVRSIGVCQIGNDIVTLSAFKNAFDVLGAFKKELPKNYTNNHYRRIESEIKEHKLDEIGLSDKNKLIFSGAIFDAQEKVYKKFSDVTDEYSKGALSTDKQKEMQIVHDLINSTAKRVIEKLGIDAKKELRKGLINIDVKIEEARTAMEKAKGNLITTLNEYTKTRQEQSDSLFGYSKQEKTDAVNELIKFLEGKKADVSKHIGALTQKKLGQSLEDWVKDNKKHAEFVLPKELYDKIDSSIKNEEQLSRNIRHTGRYGR